MDTLSDMLTVIRNGYLAHKGEVSMPYSRQKEVVAKKLSLVGFLGQIQVETLDKNKRKLKLTLVYNDNKPAVLGIQRVSKPSVRVYRPASKIPKVLGGLGEVVVSTSMGIMTGSEARAKKIGGEVILKVW